MKWLRLFRLYRIRENLVQAYRMLRNPRVPLQLKLTALGLALLILSPLNILGDLPFLGLVDDVALLAMLAGWFVRAAARHDALTTIEASALAVKT